MNVRCCSMVTLLLMAGPILYAQDGDNCRDVLQYSARNYSVFEEEIGIATKIHDQYCEGENEKSGMNIDSGAEMLIKAIPIKVNLSFGSTQERLKSFCKTFDSDYKQNIQKYQNISQVVNETTNAWVSCITLASKGVLFRPKIGATQVVLEIQRTAAAKASVTGITADPRLLDCSAPNSDTTKGYTKVGKSTTKLLTDDEFWPITCLRIPSQEKDETVYPRAEISVGTTRGAFLLPIPADAKFPYQFSSLLQHLISQTNDRISRQEMRHYSILWDDDPTNQYLVTLNAVPIHSATTSTPTEDTANLGKHDICEVSHTDYHIAINGESECLLTLDNEGNWKLTGKRSIFKDIQNQGSTTVCRARCGRIQ
jgi:hypothetical protein